MLHTTKILKLYRMLCTITLAAGVQKVYSRQKYSVFEIISGAGTMTNLKKESSTMAFSRMTQASRITVTYGQRRNRRATPVGIGESQ